MSHKKEPEITIDYNTLAVSDILDDTDGQLFLEEYYNAEADDCGRQVPRYKPIGIKTKEDIATPQYQTSPKNILDMDGDRILEDYYNAIADEAGRRVSRFHRPQVAHISDKKKVMH